MEAGPFRCTEKWRLKNVVEITKQTLNRMTTEGRRQHFVFWPVARAKSVRLQSRASASLS